MQITTRGSILLALTVLGGQLAGQSLEDLQRLRGEFEAASSQLGLPEPVKEQVEGEIPTLKQLRAIQPTSRAAPATHFGYDFFSERGEIGLWENLPLPADYLLGAGDEIIISLWGETQVRSEHTVNRNGSIYIDKIGQVTLVGRTLDEAKSYLRSRFTQVYATLGGPEPTTYVDISIGKLKLINVSFVGEVRFPGIHAVHPFSRVTTGLIQAGGLKVSGSLRDIRVTRDNREIAGVDLYSFLLSAGGAQDIQLRDQDIVFVPVRHSSVTLKGEIHRPAIYEALEGESVATMLAYAGFFKARAGLEVLIHRILPQDQRQTDDDATKIMHLPIAALQVTPVQDGDEITVPSILPVTKEVSIFGQVKKPGVYAFGNPMRVMDLMELAGGIHDDVFWKSVYSQRAELIRRNENEEFAETITIDLEKLRQGDQTHYLELQNIVQLIVRHSPFFDKPRNVFIGGEVRIPGVYTVQKNDETLDEIIQRAGGFTDQAFQTGIRMYRGGIRVILRGFDLYVNDGDSVQVPMRPGVVQVQGEVYTPGLIHYQRGNSLEDYIESAGGFTLEALKSGVSVTYANGDVKIKKRFSTPKVEEGALVYVHSRRESSPVDPTTLLTNVASIAASLATILFIIQSQSP